MNLIDALILDIQKHLASIEKGVVKAQEAEDFFADSVKRAKEIFNKDSDEWRILDRWENESGYAWRPVHKSNAYAGEKLKNKVMGLLKKLEEITGANFPVSLTENEYSFSTDQRYEAYRLLISIFKGVRENLWIVDNFLDEIIFDFIDVVNKDVQINIITDDKKSIFKRLYLALKDKNEILIEAKINDNSHDRYIVVDNKIIYSLGASINTIGKKDFMIHRLSEKKDEVMLKVQKWWEDAKEITEKLIGE